MFKLANFSFFSFDWDFIFIYWKENVIYIEFLQTSDFLVTTPPHQYSRTILTILQLNSEIFTFNNSLSFFNPENIVFPFLII